MTYQSFTPGSGSSDSFGKLKALKLPDRLDGKRVLDLGCNYGFFCFEILDRGAKEVVGIDTDASAIAAAKERATLLGVTDRVRFVHSHWDEFSETGFDLILLLSALHYAKDQPALLRNIASMLNKEGLFILEGGMLPNAKRDWTAIIRGKPPYTDMVEYPNKIEMFRILSEKFAFRVAGPSVLQPGDLVPRFVFHCRKKKRMVMLFAEGPFAGKSTFLMPFELANWPVLDIDVLILEQRNLKKTGPVADAVRSSFKEGRIDLCYKQILSSGLSNLFTEIIVERLLAMNDDTRPIMVQGAILKDTAFRAMLEERLASEDIVTWIAQRGQLKS
jgi:SAM-dependent methyltransferase